MVAAMASDADGLSNYLDIFSKEYRRPIFFCALVTIAPILYGYDGTVRFWRILAVGAGLIR